MPSAARLSAENEEGVGEEEEEEEERDGFRDSGDDVDDDDNADEKDGDFWCLLRSEPF